MHDLNQEFNFQASGYQRLMNWLLIAGSLLLIVLLPASFIIKGFCLLTFSIINYFLPQNAINSLKFIQNDEWQLETRKGITIAKLKKDSIVTRYLCILRFNIPGHILTSSYFIFPDSLSNNLYQKLIVTLRLSVL